jgi:hypothetical protein
MKNYIVIAAIVTLSFWSCRKPLKDVEDYYPKVSIESYDFGLNGAVTFTGRLDSEGASGVDYVGMCLAKGHVPSGEEYQQLAELKEDGTFSVKYYNLNNDSVYYIRAFATNSYGYSWSDVLTLGQWTIEPTVAPCNPVLNTMSDGTFNYNVYAIYGPENFAGTEQQYTLNTNFADAQFTFSEPLSTGVYTTDYSFDFDDQFKVRVLFINGSTYAMDSDWPVYVNELQPGIFEITICDAPFQVTSSAEGYYTARFQTE